MIDSFRFAKFSVEGMHCGACVRRLTAAISKVPGVEVQSVEVGSTTVAFDPSHITPQTIATAIEAGGFQVARVE